MHYFNIKCEDWKLNEDLIVSKRNNIRQNKIWKGIKVESMNLWVRKYFHIIDKLKNGFQNEQ